MSDPLVETFLDTPVAPDSHIAGQFDKREHAEPVADLVCLRDVQPTNVQWLWRNRLPLGMLSIISGDPNVGKSTLITDVASRISVGRPWPDQRDVPNPPGDVILLVAEDGLSDTVRRRVDNAGGDPSRIYVLKGLRHPEEPEQIDPFSIERDLRHLDSILSDRPAVRMVLFDPLDAFLGTEADSHKKSDVQRLLSGLTTLAERHVVSIVGLLHLRKASGDKALYRTLGSLGFVSAPRAVWLVTRDREDRAKRLMTCLKLNIAPDPDGLSFTIEDQDGTGVVHWDDAPVTMTADEALEAERPRIRTARADASEWLMSRLALGPVRVADLQDEADNADAPAWGTVKRAKIDLGVRSQKREDGWYWALDPKGITEAT